MPIAVSEAESRLTELIRRAEAGQDIVLTRNGHAAARIVAARPRQTPAERRAIIEAAQRLAAKTILPGPDVARSQDFLYDEDGRGIALEIVV